VLDGFALALVGFEGPGGLLWFGGCHSVGAYQR
jgi:hypothetical protein